MYTRMAVTRLIPLHINKGKTIAQCLTDRLEYGKNGRKTEDGKYISSYECDPRTADEEFLLAKRQYLHITGRKQEKDVIAYQIRQSFKPGEISPEKANEIGYELAKRFTKGRHAFIVATHTDRAHIHNHIYFNSTSPILPLWTVRESSGISVFHGKRSAGSATVFVWNMDYPS